VTVFQGLTNVGNLTLLALGEAAAEKPPDVNPVIQFLPMILIGLFFYFILMRPQQKEARRRQELLSTLKKNDKVVTAGGIIGTIVDLSSDGSRVTLKVDDNTRMKFLRSSITGPFEEKGESA
jgi:preprotein translocase subunit YajC